MSKIDLSKEVAKLVAMANSPLMRDLVARELEVVNSTLSTREKARGEKKKEISDKVYSDTLSDFSKANKKNITDLLTPAFAEEEKIANSNVNLYQTFIEVFGSMQLDVMRAMRRIDSEIKAITVQTENPSKIGEEEVVLSEEGNQAVIGEISKRTNKLEELQNILKGISNDILINIINKATASSRARMSQRRAEGLKEALISKSSALISYQKTLDEAIILSLSEDIDDLSNRKKLLRTSPQLLGEEILKLQRDGKQDEAIVEFRKLVLLSRGTSVGLLPENVSRFVTIPVSSITLSQLGRQEKAHQGSLLYFQKNSEYKLSNVAKTAAGIASCLKILNEIELLKEEIEAEKSIAESQNDLKSLAALRRSLLDLEPLESSLKQMSEEYYASLDREIDYINNNLNLQATEQYLLSQTSMAISQMESGINLELSSTPINERIEQIGFRALSVQEHYQVSEEQSTVEEMISSSEDPGIVEGLTGEEYNLPESIPNQMPFSDIIIESDPNSFTSDLPVEEPMVTAELPETSLDPSLQDIVAEPQTKQVLSPIPVAKPFPNDSVYRKRTGNFSPFGKEKKQKETIAVPTDVAPSLVDNFPDDRVYSKRTGNIGFPFRIGRPDAHKVISSKSVTTNKSLFTYSVGEMRKLLEKITYGSDIGMRRI